MMLLDYFGVFWLDFLKKRMKSANMGNFEVLRHDVEIPRSSVGPHQGVECPRRSVAEKEAWTSLRFAEA